MLFALFILLLLSFLVVLGMRFVKIKARHFSDSYNKEQALLFMDSVIEGVIMQIQGFDRSGGSCLRSLRIESEDGRFEANVTIRKYYLYKGLDNDQSTDLKALCPDVVESILTPQSHGYVLMDVVVSSTDHAKIGRPIRIVRRTLQRP